MINTLPRMRLGRRRGQLTGLERRCIRMPRLISPQSAVRHELTHLLSDRREHA